MQSRLDCLTKDLPAIQERPKACNDVSMRLQSSMLLDQFLDKTYPGRA